jgi:hypothetical protein
MHFRRPQARDLTPPTRDLGDPRLLAQQDGPSRSAILVDQGYRKIEAVHAQDRSAESLLRHQLQSLRSNDGCPIVGRP